MNDSMLFHGLETLYLTTCSLTLRDRAYLQYSLPTAFFADSLAIKPFVFVEVLLEPTLPVRLVELHPSS